MCGSHYSTHTRQQTTNMKVKNIEIKQRMREIEKSQDYYAKVKMLCELTGTVAFYGHTSKQNASQDELHKAEAMANETIESIIKKYNL